MLGCCLATGVGFFILLFLLIDFGEECFACHLCIGYLLMGI
jgi:hypothetical protein